MSKRPEFPGWLMIDPESQEFLAKGDVGVCLASYNPDRCTPEKGHPLDTWAGKMRINVYAGNYDCLYQVYRRIGGWKPEPSISIVASVPMPLP